MNEKEEYIMKLIRTNPYISQQELAKRLKLSRSAVAGYISSLTKNGHIKGRAYIINEKSQILCVGGANIDRKAKVQSDFRWEDSNPVTVDETVGGVARNIAENLAKLQIPTLLFTALGPDHEGDKISSHSTAYDISSSIQKDGERTGTYTAVLNEENNMVFALADMDIYEAVTVTDLKKAQSHFRSADLLIVDTNFSKDVLTSIFNDKSADKQTLAVVPVSAKKVYRLPDDLSAINYLILNVDELNAVIDRYTTPTKGDNVLNKMQRIAKLGVDNIIVTHGVKGAYYLSSNGESGQVEAESAKVEDVTGAGDAFAAGVCYSIHKGMAMKEACENGARLAKLTLETKNTVAGNIDEKIFTTKRRN